MSMASGFGDEGGAWPGLDRSSDHPGQLGVEGMGARPPWCRFSSSEWSGL